MRVRLTGAGETKVFEVVSTLLNTTTGELTLTCRDGQVCLGLIGAWEMETQSSRCRPMSCEEVERIHDGRALIALVN